MSYTPPTFTNLDIEKPETFGNLAEKLDQSTRRMLADHLIELINIDIRSMSEWLGSAKRYLDALEHEGNPVPQNLEQQGSGEDGMPPQTDLTLSAVVQFAARATGQILGEPDLAKASDENAEAKPLASWISNQLRSTDQNWTVDTDPLVIHMAVTGLAWRKRAFDDYDKTLHSNFLTCEEVIINGNVRSVNRAPRITHQFQRYPYEIDRSISRKHWVNYGPNYNETDPQAPKNFYEVDLWMDFDGDDIDEPWTITLARDDFPEVVRIRPRWSKKTIVNTDEVLFFKPIIRFFPYKFLPDPKGEFFPKGFGWLLTKVERSANSLLAAIDDTAKSASQNGGVMSGAGFGAPDKIELKGNRINVIPTDGRPLEGMYSPFQPKQVDAGMVATLDKLITLGDRLAGTLNLLENAPASMTATMAKGIIDTGTQIQSAVHRRLVGSMTAEFRALAHMADAYDLLPEDVQIATADGIAVTADPSLATDMQRSALAGIYMQLMADPLTNGKECRMRLYQTLRLPNPEALLGSPPAAPEATAVEKIKAAIDMEKARTERMKTQAGIAVQITQALKNLADAQSGMLDIRMATLQMLQLEAAVQNMLAEATDAGSGFAGLAGPSGNPGTQGALPPPAGTGDASVPPGPAGGPGDAGGGGGMVQAGGVT
jgi:hypothetical protein